MRAEAPQAECGLRPCESGVTATNMTESPAKAANRKDRGRNERLAQALRENLKRRKMQTRDREARPAAAEMQGPRAENSKRP